MDNTFLLLLTVCAVLLVVGGLVIVGGYLILRFVTGGSIFEALGFSGLGDLLGRERGEQAATPSQPARRRANLSAPDLDFDAAVARHAADDANTQRVDPKQQSDFPQTSPSDFGLPPARPLRKRRRDRNEDELFGGLMDEDGDGEVDF